MSILLKPILQNQTYLKTLLKPQFLSRTLTSSSTEGHKKPLSVLFEEVVGLRPKPEPSEVVVEEEGEGNEVKRKLLELELKITELKKSKPLKKEKERVVRTEQRSNLYKLFKEGEERKEEEEDVVRVYKELPLEMVSFVKLLHKHGYLNKANFISGEKLELGSLDDEYSRTFVKFAAERFGKDYQEIAK